MVQDPEILTEASRRTVSRRADMAVVAVVATLGQDLMDQEDRIKVTGA